MMRNAHFTAYASAIDAIGRGEQPLLTGPVFP